MRKQHSTVVLFGLCLILPALVLCSALPPTKQLQMNKLELEQPNNNQNANPDHKIVGGSTAFERQFPYMVSLRRNNQHFCGGSIISNRWILTAASCFDGNSQLDGLTAVVGTTTLNAGGVVYQVTQLIKHASYNPQTSLNDIAVIKVAEAIEFTSTVQKISLALLDPFVGTLATLTGWGYTGVSFPNELQFVDTETIDLATCALIYSKPIGIRQMCTFSSNKGACQGDVGGPLMVSGGQVGIVSLVSCAHGYPDVFTSVTSYRLWILLNTGIIL